MSSTCAHTEMSNACLLRYMDGLFHVTRKEMHRVFRWLYQGGNQYEGDYLKRFPEAMQRLGSIGKMVLIERRDSSDNFDFSILYMLLQHTCGLADHKNPIWNNPTSPEERASLEHSFYLLKEKRNTLCHEPWTLKEMTTEDLDNHLEELKRLCKVILSEGGVKARKLPSEVNECIMNMEKAFDDIKTAPIPSGMTVEKFRLMVRCEMKNNHTSSPVKGNFISPSLQNKGEDGSYRRNLKDFPLWQCGNGSNPKTIVLSGTEGIGKTAICGHVLDSWIFDNADISHLNDFDLVVPVQCRSVSTCDVIDFFREFFKQTHNLCGRDEIGAFLMSLNVLWVCDGFEETNTNTVELLKQIPQYQGTSSLILITTQPKGLEDLKKLITIETTIVVQLLGFSDDGVEDYLSEMLSGERIKFYQDVEALGKDLLKELRVPLTLKLMVELWKDGKLKKEIVSKVYSLYKKIMEAQMERIS